MKRFLGVTLLLIAALIPTFVQAAGPPYQPEYLVDPCRDIAGPASDQLPIIENEYGGGQGQHCYRYLLVDPNTGRNFNIGGVPEGIENQFKELEVITVTSDNCGGITCFVVPPPTPTPCPPGTFNAPSCNFCVHTGAPNTNGSNSNSNSVSGEGSCAFNCPVTGANGNTAKTQCCNAVNGQGPDRASCCTANRGTIGMTGMCIP